jgi:hypothetical protein
MRSPESAALNTLLRLMNDAGWLHRHGVEPMAIQRRS